jgi:putative transposase
MRTRKPEHLKTFDYLGFHQYFLTFCTYQRRRLFVSLDRVAAVRTHIERASFEQRFAITAYCFMPDHFHMLAEGQADDSDCRRFIARAKQYSGYHYRAEFQQRLWQRYGFERTLRSDESAISVARYILENPVRAGLVERIEDYPFSGSSVYTTEQFVEAVQMKRDWYSRSG